MVKFGKLYRDLQIVEFKGNYIDYKRLKQKIKQIREHISSQSTGLFSSSNFSNSLKLSLKISLQEEEVYNPTTSKFEVSDNHSNKCGEQLTVFQNLLDEEFQIFYKYCQSLTRQLHNKLNEHLYTQTNYSSYVKEDIIKEINNLKNTIYLAKCLNLFINDNMMAIKKILKKFDKKFSDYFGNFGPKYILDNLCKQNSELEKLLEFKVIDEASCIIESNIQLLKENYLELNQEIKIKYEEDDFFVNYNKVMEYLIDIDELIYFKIQYKEWFYFIKKNSVMNQQSNLYKNLMFNPILFSAYHKDDIMNKFLSRKTQIKDIEDVQIPLSFKNKVNILIIFIQTFFYNTLISGIYPLQFIYLREIQTKKEKKEEKSNLSEYSFLIISSTYICSNFSILIYHCFGTRRIKLSYIFSNIFFLLGSLFYIISYNYNEDANYIFGFLITARIFIGFGANPLMGKKYILNYAPKYFLPLISKYYVFVSILGHSMGPFFVYLFFETNSEEQVELISNFFYSKYNCIGWYGIGLSFLLLIGSTIFFTSPSSKEFRKLSVKTIKYEKEMEEKTKSEFLIEEDDESNESKEFYQFQKEMSDKNDDIKLSDNIIIDDQQLIDTEPKIIDKVKDATKDKTIHNIIGNKKAIKIRKSLTIRNTDNLNSNFNLNYQKNPLLLIEEGKDETDIFNSSEHGNFVNIDMIPRTINDLMRKEKKKFSYLNMNLLIILIILFFCNLLKENFIAYSSYYLYNRNQDNENLAVFSPTYLCLFISISYSLEMLSMFFILPLYKINTRLKKILVILISLSIVLMIPLCFELKLYVYFIIVSITMLMSSIIEVLSSAYLAYLTPPDWKISHINAGSLPFYIMNIGKLLGCLICFTSFAEKRFVHNLNNFVVIIITIIGYGISGIFIFRSDNFRIKAICRIMRKTELDSFNF